MTCSRAVPASTGAREPASEEETVIFGEHPVKCLVDVGEVAHGTAPRQLAESGGHPAGTAPARSRGGKRRKHAEHQEHDDADERCRDHGHPQIDRYLSKPHAIRVAQLPGQRYVAITEGTPRLTA